MSTCINEAKYDDEFDKEFDDPQTMEDIEEYFEGQRPSDCCGSGVGGCTCGERHEYNCGKDEECEECCSSVVGKLGKLPSFDQVEFIKQNRMNTTPVKDPYNIAKELLVERQLYGNRMGINDELCNTNLISKNYSPMFIRKFNLTALNNWPCYISMICDEDVSDIDKVVNGAIKAFNDAGLIGNNLQSMRNLTGIISETLSKHYNNKKENCVEGIAVTLYIDKAYIQSFTGDFMNHAQCRAEYTSALLMMTQI